MRVRVSWRACSRCSPISVYLPYISIHLPTPPYISPTSRYVSLHLAIPRLLALLALGTRKALRVGELHTQWRGHGECRAAACLEAQLVKGVAGAAALLQLDRAALRAATRAEGLELDLVRLGLGLGLGLEG